MTILHKLVIGLLLIAGAFGAGYYTKAQRPTVKTETKTNVVTEQVDRVVTQVVTVREKAPDGKPTGHETVTETRTEEHVQSAKTADRSTEAGKAAAGSTEQVRRTYSLGLQWKPDWKDRTWAPTGAEVGYRVLGDFWGTAAFDWKSRDITVGVRYEF